jgi:DNA-binding CsgD family transcriptional regulator
VESRDGVRIGYTCEGSGPVLLMLHPPIISNLRLFPQLPGAEQFLNRLAEGRTLVRMDFRGSGVSDRSPADQSPDALVDDLEAVVNAVHATRVDIYASSIRVVPALGFATRRPELVNRVVLTLPLTRSRGDEVLPALIESDWQLFLEFCAQRNSGRSLEECRDIIAYTAQCATQRDYLAELRATAQEDEWDLASQVTAPTLVVDFPGMSLAIEGEIAAFPRCFVRGEYLVLPRECASPPYGAGLGVVEAIQEFLGPVEPEAREVLDGALTAREVEVLRLLARGFTEPEVASALTITRPTASRHVQNIYGKLGVHRRSEAVAWAIRHGFG